VLLVLLALLPTCCLYLKFERVLKKLCVLQDNMHLDHIVKKLDELFFAFGIAAVLLSLPQ